MNHIINNNNNNGLHKTGTYFPVKKYLPTNQIMIRSSSNLNSGHYYVGQPFFLCVYNWVVHTCSVMVNQITQVLQERNTNDAERIQCLESQLTQMEQQLENLTDKQKKKTVSEDMFIDSKTNFIIYPQPMWMDTTDTYMNCI